MDEKPAEAASNATPQPESAPEQEAQPTSEPDKSEEQAAKTYLKAMPLRNLADLEKIKEDVRNGNILILKITALANKNIVDVSQAVNELYSFTEEIGGDIARLGEERIVICPQKIRIWREKAPAKNEPLPTAA
jgi:uncharacterized protein